MLEIRHLGKKFPGKTLFWDLSFSCEGAQIVKAPSGWGKTTLFRIIMGLEKPDAGSVAGAGRVCPLFQEDRLIPHLNAVQNIRLVCGPAVPEETIRMELAALGLTEQDAALPAAKLSGGQKRRTALLRALLAPGDVLLLDEPFTGLDETAVKLAAQAIRRLRADRPALAAVHEMQGIRLLEWPVLDLTKLSRLP